VSDWVLKTGLLLGCRLLMPVFPPSVWREPADGGLSRAPDGPETVTFPIYKLDHVFI